MIILNKRILSLTMAIVMMLSLGTSVFAAEGNVVDGEGEVPVVLTVEAALLDVTVPTSLPIDVDEVGEVETATDAKIINNSHGAVIINDIEMEAVAPWELIEYGIDMKAVKVNTKHLGFSLAGVEAVESPSLTNDEGALVFDKDGFRVINGANEIDDTDELVLAYDATLPAQSTEIDNLEIAKVTFIIDWFLGE